MKETAVPSRRRRAEHNRESSDLARGRGWLLAGAGAAVVVLVVLLVRDGPRSVVSPGALAPPHAAVACVGCHGSTRASGRVICTTCHVGHPSVRAGHRALAVSGSLACTDCHGSHGAEAGVAFEPSGAVSVYRGGAERAVDGERDASTKGARVTYVPLVARERCERCHDGRDVRDVAAVCLARSSPFAVCFDEHRRVATASASVPARRDALAERARVIALGPAPRELGGAGTNTPVVALGLGVAGLVLAFERRRRRPSTPLAAPALAPHGVRRLPVIDAARCLGCHACVDACPYDALVIRRYVAVLARPDECCGAGPCQSACPNGSLELRSTEAEASGRRLSTALESLERPGIFLAGDVTGGSLVRNALRQGAAAARGAAAALDRRRRAGGSDIVAEYDLVIVGAGPAGLAAALTAKELGLRAVVLEQSRLAASIVSFSRGKLVLDTPSGEDERLPLFIGDVTKEELVARWRRTVRAAHLDVREGTRLIGITGDWQSGFQVRVERAAGTGSSVSGRAVILAVGTRGTPRELDVPVAPEAAANVHYELSDARAFAGRRTVVVGLGDVAMESALALAAQPGTQVTVLHRGAGFRRGKQRNVDALAALVARGRVRLIFDARVARVNATTLEVTVAGRTHSLIFDSLFVHVGRVVAHDLFAPERQED